MKIEIYYTNKGLLNKEINYFRDKNLIIKSINNKLIYAHFKKARHNLNFFLKNSNELYYNDWLIVILYYSLYHCALALVIKSGFVSKNHKATILLLIKYYSIPIDEINMLNNLLINKDDAEFYTELKTKRHNASYSASHIFKKSEIESYHKKVIKFLNKVELIINN